MIASAITAVIGNYMISCFVLGFVVSAVHLSRHRVRDRTEISGVLLNNFVLYALGVSMVINFVMHSFFGDFAASTIGWAQSPFQLELALMSLGVGVAAIIVHGRTSQLRAKTAALASMAIFSWGAASGHVYQAVVNDNHAVNNTGLLLASDVAIPAIGLALLVWHATARQTHQLAATDATVTTDPEESGRRALRPPGSNTLA